MIEYEREKAIKEYLGSSTFASVKDLARILNVSDATIRRDMRCETGDARYEI